MFYSILSKRYRFFNVETFGSNYTIIFNLLFYSLLVQMITRSWICEQRLNGYTELKITFFFTKKPKQADIVVVCSTKNSIKSCLKKRLYCFISEFYKINNRFIWCSIQLWNVLIDINLKFKIKKKINLIKINVNKNSP